MTTNPITDKALSYVGLSWCRNALPPDGIDSFGLVRAILRDCFGKETPSPVTWDPAWTSKEPSLERFCQDNLIRTSQATPGTVLLFHHDKAPGQFGRTIPKTLGIYLPNNRMVVAYWARACTIAKVSPWWTTRLHSIWSFPQHDT